MSQALLLLWFGAWFFPSVALMSQPYASQRRQLVGLTMFVVSIAPLWWCHA